MLSIPRTMTLLVLSRVILTALQFCLFFFRFSNFYYMRNILWYIKTKPKIQQRLSSKRRRLLHLDYRPSRFGLKEAYGLHLCVP